MKRYRLGRRFVLRAVGFNLVAAGVAAAVAIAFGEIAWVAWVGGVIASLLIVNLLRILALPPVVVRLEPDRLLIGGPLTVSRVAVPWTAVEGVSIDAGNLFVDRGDAGVLSLPLAYVGKSAPAMVREIYDRLNTANGYVRFDPSADG